MHATLWEANAVDGPVSPAWLSVVGRRRAQLAELGMPHPRDGWLACNEAFGHLHAGDLDACSGSSGWPWAPPRARSPTSRRRLSAAWMAAIQGRTHEAEGHLARADELFAETSTFLAFEFDAVRAMVLLSGGHHRRALEAALTGTATAGAPPTMCEWLLPLAARALADLAQHERDHGGDPTPCLDEIEALVARFPDPIVDVGGMTPFYRRQLTVSGDVPRGGGASTAGAGRAPALAGGGERAP